LIAVADLGHTYRTELSNGVPIQDIDPADGEADLSVNLTKQQLLGLLGRSGRDHRRRRRPDLFAERFVAEVTLSEVTLVSLSFSLGAHDRSRV
jgi:hypothetical protein